MARGETWAMLGKSMSGPVSPGATIFAGVLFFVGAIAAGISSRKKLAKRSSKPK